MQTLRERARERRGEGEREKRKREGGREGGRESHAPVSFRTGNFQTQNGHSRQNVAYEGTHKLWGSSTVVSVRMTCPYGPDSLPLGKDKQGEAGLP